MDNGQWTIDFESTLSRGAIGVVPVDIRHYSRPARLANQNLGEAAHPHVCRRYQVDGCSVAHHPLPTTTTVFQGSFGYHNMTEKLHLEPENVWCHVAMCENKWNKVKTGGAKEDDVD